MKKTKTKADSKAGASVSVPWWPVLAGAVAFVLVWVVYGPALRGPFVFDDRFLPFMREGTATRPFLDWVLGNRPLLMATFWLNFQLGATAPFGYHVVNVGLHFGTAVVVGLVVAKLLELAGTGGTKRTSLALFGGALFLLHPLQTESVAYVVSRSETLSVLLYFSAFAVYLCRPAGPTGWGRTGAIALLAAAALSTKEHTLTLPALLLLTDFFFHPRGLRENLRVYLVLGLVAMGGAVGVSAVLRSSTSAGFSLESISPATYAFTQFRVIWSYVRLFFLPVGQNLDPDIAHSHTLLEHGSIAGLIGLLAAAAVAWKYRARFPLAAYGWAVFLLLLAPTSSVVPLLDVLAEHRLYLPCVGLILMGVEILRRVPAAHATWACIGILGLCSTLTFQRAKLWGDPVLLWADTAAKSPRKMRPNFQLAYAYSQKQQCREADKYFGIAAGLEKPSTSLLVDWALNDQCLERYDAGIRKLQQADAQQPSAAIKATMSILYGATQQWPQVLLALDAAEKADPSYPYTYAYRGDYYEVQGDLTAAAAQYRKALSVAPWLQKAKDGLARVSK